MNKLLYIILLLPIMFSLVSSFQINTFNNSLSFENIKLIANVSQTRFLSIPSNNNLLNAFMNISYPNYNTCYQEYANQSTICGGLNTGAYWLDTNLINSTYSIDGDWSTYSMGITTNNYLFINYTLPSQVNNVTWEVKYGNSTLNNIYNMTIPNYCLNRSDNKVMLSINMPHNFGQIVFYCFNETNQFELYRTLGQNGISFYEEALIYNITNTSLTNPSISVGNNTVWNFNGSFNQFNNKTNNFYAVINNYLSTCTYVNNYCQVPIIFNSQTSGTIQYSNLQFDNTFFNETNQTFNYNTYETKQENFSINIPFNSSVATITNAYLIYANQTYIGIISTLGTNTTISTSINIPLGVTNNSFYWTFRFTDAFGIVYYINSTIKSQTVNLLNMSLCGSPYTVPFINFTFHNDTLLRQSVTAIFVSSFNYWLGDGSINKTYSYSSAIENPSYAFCFTPNNTTIYLSSNGYYSNSYSNQRNFVNTSILTNSTTTKDLLLLPTTQGSYISFIIQNYYTQRIVGALISITKSSNGAFVEQRYTDGTGIATFSLDPNTNYIITVTASGYSLFSSSLTPSSSPVTYTLTSSTSTSGTTPTQGVNIIITPSTNQLNNNTIYTFGFNINSSKSFDEYGFVLFNSTSQISNIISGSSTHGSYISTILDSGNQSYIIMDYYYIINGVTVNSSVYWYVVTPEGTDTSIANFFTDLNNYVGTNSSGLFGVKRGTTNGDFTFAILIFLITFFIAGVMTYKYGITNVTAIMFLIFAIILFFDVGANLIPTPINAVPHFITIITGFVAIGMFIRELL